MVASVCPEHRILANSVFNEMGKQCFLLLDWIRFQRFHIGVVFRL